MRFVAELFWYRQPRWSSRPPGARGRATHAATSHARRSSPPNACTRTSTAAAARPRQSSCRDERQPRPACGAPRCCALPAPRRLLAPRAGVRARCAQCPRRACGTASLRRAAAEHPSCGAWRCARCLRAARRAAGRCRRLGRLELARAGQGRRLTHVRLRTCGVARFTLLRLTAVAPRSYLRTANGVIYEEISVGRCASARSSHYAAQP
jgi:hypothetical protein